MAYRPRKIACRAGCLPTTARHSYAHPAAVPSSQQARTPLNHASRPQSHARRAPQLRLSCPSRDQLPVGRGLAICRAKPQNLHRLKPVPLTPPPNMFLTRSYELPVSRANPPPPTLHHHATNYKIHRIFEPRVTDLERSKYESKEGGGAVTGSGCRARGSAFWK